METIDAVVERMHHSVMNPQSVEHEMPRHIVVHGGNGYCEPIAQKLGSRLGAEYRVDAVSDEDISTEPGKFYFDADWFLGTGRYKKS